MKWYVLHVRTGQENDIKAELIRLGYTSVVPTEIVTERHGNKITSVEKIVFQGYVFIALDITDSDYYAITAIPGIIRFLGVNRPEALQESETEYIDWLANEGKPLGISDISITEGKKVTVIHGPLKGFEGIITGINKRQRRAYIALSLGGQTQTFSLAINVLEAN